MLSVADVETCQCGSGAAYAECHAVVDAAREERSRLFGGPGPHDHADDPLCERHAVGAANRPAMRRTDLTRLIPRMARDSKTLLHAERAFATDDADQATFQALLRQHGIRLSVDSDPSPDRLSAIQHALDRLVGGGICRVHPSSDYVPRGFGRNSAVRAADGTLDVFLASAGVGWPLLIVLHDELQRRGAEGGFFAQYLLAAATAFEMVLDSQPPLIDEIPRVAAAQLDSDGRPILSSRSLLDSILAETVLSFAGESERSTRRVLDGSRRRALALAVPVIIGLARPAGLDAADAVAGEELGLEEEDSAWLAAQLTAAGLNPDVRELLSGAPRDLDDIDACNVWSHRLERLLPVAQDDGVTAHIDTAARASIAPPNKAQQAATVFPTLEIAHLFATLDEAVQHAKAERDMVLEKLQLESDHIVGIDQSVADINEQITELSSRRDALLVEVSDHEEIVAAINDALQVMEEAAPEAEARAIVDTLEQAGAAMATVDQDLAERWESRRGPAGEDPTSIADLRRIIEEFETADRAGIFANMPAIRSRVETDAQRARADLATMGLGETAEEGARVNLPVAAILETDEHGLHVAVFLPVPPTGSAALRPGTVSLAVSAAAGEAMREIVDMLGGDLGNVLTSSTVGENSCLVRADAPLTNSAVDLGTARELFADMLTKALQTSPVSAAVGSVDVRILPNSLAQVLEGALGV